MRLRILPAVAFVAVLLIACGGDDEAPVPLTSTQASDGPTATTVVEATATQAGPTRTPEVTEAVPTETATSQPQGSIEPVEFKPEPAGVGIFILTDVRIGAHPEDGGFDRVVFEFEPRDGDSSAHPGGRVAYVTEAYHCGSGEPIESKSDAILAVRLESSQAHNDMGELTIDAARIDGTGQAVVGAQSFCDFEGLVEWAIGIKGQQAFRTTFLDDPARLVIDIDWP